MDLTPLLPPCRFVFISSPCCFSLCQQHLSSSSLSGSISLSIVSPKLNPRKQMASASTPCRAPATGRPGINDSPPAGAPPPAMATSPLLIPAPPSLARPASSRDGDWRAVAAARGTAVLELGPPRRGRRHLSSATPPSADGGARTGSSLAAGPSSLHGEIRRRPALLPPFSLRPGARPRPGGAPEL